MIGRSRLDLDFVHRLFNAWISEGGETLTPFPQPQLTPSRRRPLSLLMAATAHSISAELHRRTACYTTARRTAHHTLFLFSSSVYSLCHAQCTALSVSRPPWRRGAWPRQPLTAPMRSSPVDPYHRRVDPHGRVRRRRSGCRHGLFCVRLE